MEALKEFRKTFIKMFIKQKMNDNALEFALSQGLDVTELENLEREPGACVNMVKGADMIRNDIKHTTLCVNVFPNVVMVIDELLYYNTVFSGTTKKTHTMLR